MLVLVMFLFSSASAAASWYKPFEEWEVGVAIEVNQGDGKWDPAWYREYRKKYDGNYDGYIGVEFFHTPGKVMAKLKPNTTESIRWHPYYNDSAYAGDLQKAIAEGRQHYYSTCYNGLKNRGQVPDKDTACQQPTCSNTYKQTRSLKSPSGQHFCNRCGLFTCNNETCWLNQETMWGDSGEVTKAHRVCRRCCEEVLLDEWIVATTNSGKCGGKTYFAKHDVGKVISTCDDTGKMKISWRICTGVFETKEVPQDKSGKLHLHIPDSGRTTLKKLNEEYNTWKKTISRRRLGTMDKLTPMLKLQIEIERAERTAKCTNELHHVN